MEQIQRHVAVGWFGCPLVEVDPEKLSGVPILRGTRLQADSVVENYDEDGSPIEEISENFDIPEAIIREVLAYAARQEPTIKL